MLTMTGSSNFLKLAPEVLVIPPNGSKNSNVQLPGDAHVSRGRGPTKEEKIATLLHGASRVVTTKDELSYSEAVAYLDMADGDMDRAITNVREDFGWSAEEGKIETGFRVVRGGGEDRDRHRRHQRGIIIVADRSDGAGGSSSSGADAFRSSRLLGNGRLGRGRRLWQHPRGLRHVLED